MHIRKAVSDFINYSPQHFNGDEIRTEFNHKYEMTVLKIDGRYYRGIYLNDAWEIVGEDILTHEEKLFKEVKTLERFLPKTGFYATKDSLYYLYRLPARQYKKSFFYDGNYNALCLWNGQEDFYKVITDPETQYEPEIISFKDILWLHARQVGKIKDQTTVYLFNDDFYHEVKELCPQLKIILDANDQEKPSVEKLILDFL